MGDNLKGKKAVITGSTTGIGKAVAKAFASRGADVFLNGLGDAEKIESFRMTLQSEYGIKAYYNDADLRKGKEAAGLIEDAASRMGSVDILVNNASLQHSCKIDELPVESFRDIIAVNLSAPFHTIRAALPLMRKQNFGRIINMASVHGLAGRPRQAGLASSNHGVLGLTKVVALEVARQNITCNAICPAWVDTDSDAREFNLHAQRVGASNEEAKAYLLAKRQPIGRLIKVEEIAEMAVYLCGTSAASINGAALPIDGGWLAQ